MSAFGCIGTPRMHPCVSHPSCGQYNATDVIQKFQNHGHHHPTVVTPTPIPTVEHVNTPSFLSTQPPPPPHPEERRMIPEISSVALLSPVSSISTPQANVHWNEEAHKKYVEIAPGVWSYM